MVIIELKDKIPTVTGMAQSTSKKSVEEHLGTIKIMYATYQGSPVWCRTEERKEIESYWDGKYTEPDKHFT